MGQSEEPDELAEEAERERMRLQKGVDELGEQIDRVREEWHQKRNDPNVPGAPPEDEPATGEGA